RQIQTLQGRVVLDIVRRRRVRLLPDDLALVHIERRDAVIRRLDQRQPLYVSSPASTAPCSTSPGRSTKATESARSARSAPTRASTATASTTGSATSSTAPRTTSTAARRSRPVFVFIRFIVGRPQHARRVVRTRHRQVLRNVAQREH